MKLSLEQQIEQLRTEYKTATRERKVTIELQARCLKTAIWVRDKKKPIQQTRIEPER
jgi:hypothetical protein